MSAALEDQHKRLRALVDHHRAALSKAVTAARHPKSTQTFAQQMNALREATKTDHRARIDAMFASFTAIGTAHPAARPVILDTGNKVATFGAGVAAGASHVIATVTSAVAAGGSAIAKAADTVGKWASSATHSVEHFFSSLF
jgi:formiminotetrahydrofolate cyclodeaminase